MAIISAKGKTDYGDLEVRITGEDTVDTIECRDLYIMDIIRKGIREGKGWLANRYHPPKNTMLQAYAFLLSLFHSDDVKVYGEICKMPYQPGLVY